ncbi:hypothetical protein B2G71_01970 [Novosphingobium sp. PC22D]|uniref:hypothetical protein n=1 Tax=Novosphingobium sp. PC22D TaxID=1962403 RepID=UPI000BF0D187|nr:hypothetical protein [Novosphingobium sp. PC22D]PEQ14387.1 hypothetical protein B2G71_01970 [Novosphingobium sp. PC22D]
MGSSLQSNGGGLAAGDGAMFDLAMAARKSARRRREIVGASLDGEAWELLVEAFLARLGRRRDALPLVPERGALREALDPVVCAGLAVLLPAQEEGGVRLELSAEGRKRFRRYFATMARDEAQAAALGAR